LSIAIPSLSNSPIPNADSFPISCSEHIRYTLADVHSECVYSKADSILQILTDRERIGQMIVVAYGRFGYSSERILGLIQHRRIGGILMLSGYKSEFKNQIEVFNISNIGIPILYSADAEPSLINTKIKGTSAIIKTNQIKDSNTCRYVASSINQELREIGIQHNFAPIIDFSSNKKIIGNRSFGLSHSNIVTLSEHFISQSNTDNILTTLKHFPGHGMVLGDSHKEEVYINGDMKELMNFKSLANNCHSIMMGHIVLKNNDYSFNNYPASCNRNLITQLLRNEWQYQGLIVTDAMNMAAAQKVKNAELEAIKAGVDMLLMPSNVESTIEKIYDLYSSDLSFRYQIDESVKRILRYKICLGLIL